MKRECAQMPFDFRRLYVMANYWGPVYHLAWDKMWTAWPDEQTYSFRSIDEAIEFARVRGIEAEVPEETRKRWCDEA